MRTEAELRDLLREINARWNVRAKRPLDRGRLLGTLCMMVALEWALGERGNEEKILEIVRLELADAVRHANR
jgi:hypothetical protein